MGAEIAAAVITILSPYLAKAGEGAAKKVAEGAYKIVTDIHQAIRMRFNKEEDDYPSQTLQRFEENPEKRKGAMQEVLEEILDKDSDFSQSLLTLLKEADKADAGAVFNVTIFGGKVGQILNINKLEGDVSIH